MMKRKLLQAEGGVWRYQLYNEGRIDSGRTLSGWNPAFNLYYIYIFLPYLHHSKMITSIHFFNCILNLLSFIGTMYWTTFLYELYSNSLVLVYIKGGAHLPHRHARRHPRIISRGCYEK